MWWGRGSAKDKGPGLGGEAFGFVCACGGAMFFVF